MKKTTRHSFSSAALVAGAVLFGTPATAFAQDGPELAAKELAAKDLAAKIDKQFRKAYPDDEPGATVIITKKGEVVFRNHYGKASVELGVDTDPSHAFCLASVTKPFTAMAIMALVEDGKLALSDKASKWHDNLELDERITVEHLLSHTAGIPDFTTQEAFDHSHIHKNIEPDELCLAAKGLKPMFDPGSKYRYSNIHYALLARIVEKASGKSWEQFLDERICKPAGMSNSMYGGHNRIVKNLVQGYTKVDGDWQRAQALSFTRGYGLGGWCSTVDDLAKWSVAYTSGKILKLETIARMQTPPTLADGSTSNYALGWMVRDVDGHDIVFHGGGIYGWGTIIARIPKQDVFVAVLTNRDTEDNPIGRLAIGAAALVAGK